MAYQALYRKYRPKSFSLVYGQDAIIKTLLNVIKNNHLSHAYLFTGPRGTGKTSSAKLFAKSVNCLNNKNGDSCNECENCISFNENSNPDIIEIDAASNNGVDEIRELKSKINLVPSNSKYKVYIIDEVHMLSIGAFNALLKTLEEPPKHVIFILATTEPQKLPITVISRCQRFDFKNISNMSMKKCLKNIVNQENISISEEALDEIISTSKGGMRDAIGLLDQAWSFSDGQINLENIENLSGTISEQQSINIFNQILSSDVKKVLNFIDYCDANGKDLTLIVEKSLLVLRKILISKKTGIIDNISPQLLEFSNLINDLKLYFLIDEFEKIASDLKNSSHKRISLEVGLIKLIDNVEGSEYQSHNVSRETLIKNKNVDEKSANSLKNEILLADNHDSNVLFDTSERAITDLKNIRINNILCKASKNILNELKSNWNKINNYLIDSYFKITAGLLLETVPVAASNDGIIISVPNNAELKRCEKNYDISKELINKIFQKNYKLVYITAENWKIERPKYAEAFKNNELILIDESELISKIKNEKEKSKSNPMSEFDEFVEMEI